VFELFYAGFDTIDIAIAGALPKDALARLKAAREQAQETQEEALVNIGPGEVQMHVSGHGMRGGYAFLCDTGPLGAKWMVKENTDPRQWNLFVSPRAQALLAYGYAQTWELILADLAAMGGTVTDISLNRVDFAMDFRTKGFELRQDCVVAHTRTKVAPYWGKRPAETDMEDRNQPSAVMRGRRLESLTIGKQPGRQIILYDKRREAVEKQKPFWFKTWGVDRDDPTLEVWRIEVRAGKKELKDKYQIRSLDDFEDSIGDVIVNALQEVRYLAHQQTDGNVIRQELHPIWAKAQEEAAGNLLALRSGLTPDQVKEIERGQAVETYSKLAHSNAIGLAVALGLSDAEIMKGLFAHIAPFLEPKAARDFERMKETIERVRGKLVFQEQIASLP